MVMNISSLISLQIIKNTVLKETFEDESSNKM
jgi:hypothetical protein